MGFLPLMQQHLFPQKMENWRGFVHAHKFPLVSNFFFSAGLRPLVWRVTRSKKKMG